MSVQWFKFSANIFDDDKIRIIESYPEGDTILTILFKLFCMAAKCNMKGFIKINETMAYGADELPVIFNKPAKTVEMAIGVLKRFQIIEIHKDNSIFIKNWDKYQNIDGMERIKEQNRIRISNFRQRKKQSKMIEYTGVSDSSNVTCNVTDNDKCNVTGNVTVTHSNAIDIDIERDKDIDKDKDINKNSTDGSCLYINNNIVNSKGIASETEKKPAKQANKIPNKILFNKKTSSFENITDTHLSNFKKAYPLCDITGELNKMVVYLSTTDKSYTDFGKFIRNWFIRTQERLSQIKPAPVKEYYKPERKQENQEQQEQDELTLLWKKAITNNKYQD